VHRGEHAIHGPRPSRHGPRHDERSTTRKLCKFDIFLHFKYLVIFLLSSSDFTLDSERLRVIYLIKVMEYKNKYQML
jgi:hypothetical protein